MTTEKVYSIPKKYTRKDFPLLFPKSPADENAIRAIANSWSIEYDWLKNELFQLQEPHKGKEEFRTRNKRFKEEYKWLFNAVRGEGEKYGIELGKYAISNPKPRTESCFPESCFPLLHPRNSDEAAIRMIAESNDINYEALLEGEKVIEHAMGMEKKEMLRITNYFRSKYNQLLRAVLREGKEHGIILNDYRRKC